MTHAESVAKKKQGLDFSRGHLRFRSRDQRVRSTTGWDRVRLQPETHRAAMRAAVATTRQELPALRPVAEKQADPVPTPTATSRERFRNLRQTAAAFVKRAFSGVSFRRLSFGR